MIPAAFRNRATLSMAEVAEATGLAISTVRGMVGKGELSSVKVGARRLIHAKAVWEMLGIEESREQETVRDQAVRMASLLARSLRG